MRPPYLCDKQKRAAVLCVAAVMLLLVTGYTAAFWNASGPLGTPVALVRSIYQSDAGNAGDRESNSWRDLEKFNLRATIARAPLLGIGFGRQYRFWVEEPSLDPTGFVYWRFVTHNTVYWLWMKLGAVGFAVFWWVIGGTIITGTLVFRREQDAALKASA